jgi:hypothetical protein
MWKKRKMRGRLIAKSKGKKRKGRRHSLMAQVRLSFFFDSTFIVVVIFQYQVMFCANVSE